MGETEGQCGRENKIERETGSVMSEEERDRVGRKIQKNILKRETAIERERETGVG